jgi:ribosomal protein S12 methylthiotransferase accessory factor YcaO
MIPMMAKSKNLNPLHPDIFAAFSKNQYKDKQYSRFKYSTKTFFQWCEVLDLKQNTYLIPAHLIYLSLKEKKLLRLQDSTGAAAGFSIEQALYAGITEIIERDAFALFYFGKQKFTS